MQQPSKRSVRVNTGHINLFRDTNIMFFCSNSTKLCLRTFGGFLKINKGYLPVQDKAHSTNGPRDNHNGHENQ